MSIFSFLRIKKNAQRRNPPQGYVDLVYNPATGQLAVREADGSVEPLGGSGGSFEFESAEVLGPDQLALTSNVRRKICSVTLSPGTWLVSGSFFIGLSEANVSYREAAILTASDEPTGIKAYVNIRSQNSQSVGDEGALMTRRMVLTETTEVGLYITANFSTGSAAGAGSIEAIKLS